MDTIARRDLPPSGSGGPHELAAPAHHVATLLEGIEQDRTAIFWG